MSIAKILEDALRAKGINATVQDTAPEDKEVSVTVTYAIGDVYVTVDGPLTDINRITLQNSNDECITFSGEDAQALVELMYTAMQGMERTA